MLKIGGFGGDKSKKILEDEEGEIGEREKEGGGGGERGRELARQYAQGGRGGGVSGEKATLYVESKTPNTMGLALVVCASVYALRRLFTCACML